MIKSAFSDTAFRIQMFFFPSLTQNNQIMQPFAHVNMHLGALKCIVYVALKPMSCVLMGGGEGGRFTHEYPDIPWNSPNRHIQ